MLIFFEIIKVVFFTLTIVVGIIFSSGESLFNTVELSSFKAILLPGYLIFAGLMIGYIIGHLLSVRYDEYHRKSRITGCVLGLIIGFILALVYVLA